MRAWHFIYARSLVYAVAAVATAGILVASCWGSPGIGVTLVSARQLFGLWALGFLLASLLIGPLTFVLPWLPWKSSLMYGRRAVGVCSLLFALLHVICYFWSVLLRNWRELYTPGILWVAGLVLGLIAIADLTVLAITSRDAAVKRMGGRAWKRLHRTVYLVLGVVLIHALFIGADFGINRGPDVNGEVDFGSGIAFLAISIGWVTLFVLRYRGIRWNRNPIRSRPVDSTI